MGSNLPPTLTSKFYEMVFAQFTSSDDTSVMMLFTYSFYDLSYCCDLSIIYSSSSIEYRQVQAFGRSGHKDQTPACRTYTHTIQNVN